MQIEFFGLKKAVRKILHITPLYFGTSFAFEYIYDNLQSGLLSIYVYGDTQLTYVFSFF